MAVHEEGEHQLTLTDVHMYGYMYAHGHVGMVQAQGMGIQEQDVATQSAADAIRDSHGGVHPEAIVYAQG